jgi:hypothetical protein
MLSRLQGGASAKHSGQSIVCPFALFFNMDNHKTKYTLKKGLLKENL